MRILSRRSTSLSKDRMYWWLVVPAISVCSPHRQDASVQSTSLLGSHVIYTLQKTRRYKVISIDNYHNSLPAALARVSRLSENELPQNATSLERESTKIDSINCDLTKPEQLRAVFEKYKKGGIWGVVHIAVSPAWAKFSVFKPAS